MPDIYCLEKETANDAFYCKSNIDHLKQVIENIDNGKTKLVEHDLIEID